MKIKWYQKAFEDMKGQEIWTDLLGERTVVGIISGDTIMEWGKKIKLTKKSQYKQLWDDLMEQEGL